MGLRALVDKYKDQFPAIQLIGNTPMIRVRAFEAELPDVEIHVKVESFNPGGSLKDRPVLYMLLDALDSGKLDGKTILDSSSGNAAIAYAWIGKVLGIPVRMVVPANASAERKKRIRAHGAEIFHTDAQDGYDEALREVRRQAKDTERYYFSDQYGNSYNWKAHLESTAEEIWAQTGGRITHFVAGVGTGGTITGVGKGLKAKNPNVEIHCVVPDAFPGVEGLKPLKEEGDIVPEIFDAKVVDKYWDADVDKGWDMNQRLAGVGLFGGQSSGIYLAGVYDLAKSLPKGQKAVIVTLLCDIGERYMSTRLWDLG